MFEGNKRYEQVNKRSWNKILKEMSKAGKKENKEESTINMGDGGMATDSSEL